MERNKLIGLPKIQILSSMSVMLILVTLIMLMWWILQAPLMAVVMILEQYIPAQGTAAVTILKHFVNLWGAMAVIIIIVYWGMSQAQRHDWRGDEW